jgi:hypothetical protein
MLRTFITVDRREFCLAPDQNLAELKNQIVATVKAGGGMIELPVAGGTTVNVLVGPGIGVQFRQHEAPIENEPVLAGPSHADFDEY